MTPQHSPRPSDATSTPVTTAPTSPPRHIPNSPPRLSLRFSTINTVDLSINLDTQPTPVQEDQDEDGSQGQNKDHDGRQNNHQGEDQNNGQDEADSQNKGQIEHSQDREGPQSPLMVTSKSPPPESPPGSPPASPPRSPPARNPRRVSQRPEVLLEAPKLELPNEEKNDEEEEPLYILQPRTYTPQLPSPQPSPRVIDRPPSRVPETHSRDSSASSVESAAQLKLEQAKPRIEQIVVKPHAQKLRVIEIGGRADLRPPPRRSTPRPDLYLVSGPDPAQAPELVVEPEQAPMLQPTPRTSLRQRVSLKTNPPQSIQVPSPNGYEMQQAYNPAYRGYQAPDSAYGSDMERPPVHSMASINSSLADFPPPAFQPGMIPSPHSERQFFRPVQANPYSPLQQRPHTSGTVGPHHFPAPPRNAPSRMGMSIMSNGSAMTNQTSSGKTVKKKRSALGWLKKAFSLDEEERATFEQKRREQMANPYNEPKTPQFLDGKRIRPRQGGY